LAIYSTSIPWENINSTTERVWLPGVQDNIWKSNLLFDTLHNEGTKLDGGSFIAQAVLYGEGPGGFYVGPGPVNLAGAEHVTIAQYNWRQAYAGGSIEYLDELRNNGRAAFAKIISVKLDAAEMTMQNTLGTGLYSDGTLPGYLTGLNAMVTNTGSYGGIPKSTNPWWQSVVTNMSGVSLTLYKLRQLAGQVTDGMIRPNLIMTTQAIYDLIYNLHVPQQRFGDQNAKGGFTNLMFEDMAIGVDYHCPSGYLYMLNTKYIDFVSHSNDNMKFWGWDGPHDQFFKSFRVSWTGNLTGSNCRRQAVMYNVA